MTEPKILVDKSGQARSVAPPSLRGAHVETKREEHSRQFGAKAHIPGRFGPFTRQREMHVAVHPTFDREPSVRTDNGFNEIQRVFRLADMLVQKQIHPTPLVGSRTRLAERL